MNTKNPLNKIEELKKEGYEDHLQFNKNEIVNHTNKKNYGLNDIKHVEEFRFEGLTNPSDMSLLFAVEFKDNHKGTITAAYGSDGNADLFDFMEKAKP